MQSYIVPVLLDLQRHDYTRLTGPTLSAMLSYTRAQECRKRMPAAFRVADRFEKVSASGPAPYAGVLILHICYSNKTVQQCTLGLPVDTFPSYKKLLGHSTRAAFGIVTQ